MWAPPVAMSEVHFTLVHMGFHMWKALVRPGVTRNLRIPPAAEQSTAVINCRAPVDERRVPAAAGSVGERGEGST
jgi:hypothetical protein